MAAHEKAVTYTTYLKVDELLSLQEPLSDGPEHDELLFITIHQVYELWFQQILHELGALQVALEAGDSHRSLALLGRVRSILKTCVQQIDVLETMTPLQFKSFRARLSSASGFQSAQFREVEAVLGRRDHAGGGGGARETAAAGRRVGRRRAVGGRPPGTRHPLDARRSPSGRRGSQGRRGVRGSGRPPSGIIRAIARSRTGGRNGLADQERDT